MLHLRRGTPLIHSRSKNMAIVEKTLGLAVALGASMLTFAVTLV